MSKEKHLLAAESCYLMFEQDLMGKAKYWGILYVRTLISMGWMEREEHMKFILIPLVCLMVPFAFVVVAFDVAKAFVEDKVESKLKQKNGYAEEKNT